MDLIKINPLTRCNLYKPNPHTEKTEWHSLTVVYIMKLNVTQESNEFR